MQIKSELRREFRAKRKTVCEKAQRDNSVCEIFLNSDIYKNSKQILCYASLDDEICTDKIINAAFEDGKKIALPYCVDLNGNMEFYYINSFSDISIGSFDIREPNIKICEKVIDLSGAVCIVPAFTFDIKGYRLGYGKGYYDRFLKKFTIISVGLCYNNFLRDDLPVNEFDVAVNYIATEDK
ncbi:MAG: 5-formyltetrahydrofolate cyclo-ligase, partial [Eubacterium sp.]|nr:5-formyltetrahydrofolate cyclo-ligase [Eubacterium sp.]